MIAEIRVKVQATAAKAAGNKALIDQDPKLVRLGIKKPDETIARV
jgi:hypothetical protein